MKATTAMIIVFLVAVGAITYLTHMERKATEIIRQEAKAAQQKPIETNAPPPTVSFILQNVGGIDGMIGTNAVRQSVDLRFMDDASVTWGKGKLTRQ